MHTNMSKYFMKKKIIFKPTYMYIYVYRVPHTKLRNIYVYKLFYKAILSLKKSI